MDVLLSCLLWFLFFILGYAAATLPNYYDVKMPCHLILSKLADKCPSSVLAVLDSLVDHLQKTVNFRPKQDVVKQEVDRNELQLENGKSETLEIAMFEHNIIIYKFAQGLHFFATRGDDEIKLIISTVLQGFFDAVGLLLRGNVDKKEALENLDLILLCLDEIVVGGIILETDANVIAGKVASHSVDSGAPLSEQTISQALATAREHLTRSFLNV